MLTNIEPPKATIISIIVSVTPVSTTFCASPPNKALHTNSNISQSHAHKKLKEIINKIPNHKLLIFKCFKIKVATYPLSTPDIV